MVYTSRRLHPRLIAIPTKTGATARRVTRYRLDPWIVAFSHSQDTCQRLAFSYGIHPVYLDDYRHDWRRIVSKWCAGRKMDSGIVVMTQGSSTTSPERTNQIEVFSLGDEIKGKGL